MQPGAVPPVQKRGWQPREPNRWLFGLLQIHVLSCGQSARLSTPSEDPRERRPVELCSSRVLPGPMSRKGTKLQGPSCGMVCTQTAHHHIATRIAAKCNVQPMTVHRCNISWKP